LFDDYCLPRMRRGESIETCWVSGPWWDIGTPERYLQTNQDWLGRLGGLEPSFVAPSARVDPGVTLGSSVVGRGARVLGSGRLERCVIWPESVAHAPLSGCIVTPSGVLRVGPPASP
jgi:NDP-sugar pyrophosphorylase family protein